MSSNLEFLKEQIEICKKKIANSAEYKRMKVLEQLLVELEGTPRKPDILESIMNRQKEETENKKEDKTIWPSEPIKTINVSKRTYFERDNENSPVVHIPWGTRIAQTYDLVEKIVKQYKGEITVPDLKEILEIEYNIDLSGKDEKGNSKISRILSYINAYNKYNEDNIRLRLEPSLLPDGKRVRKYVKVIYVGRERLTNVG